jgi:hypothetical protein
VFDETNSAQHIHLYDKPLHHACDHVEFSSEFSEVQCHGEWENRGTTASYAVGWCCKVVYELEQHPSSKKTFVLIRKIITNMNRTLNCGFEMETVWFTYTQKDTPEEALPSKSHSQPSSTPNAILSSRDSSPGSPTKRNPAFASSCDGAEKTPRR